MPRLPYDVMAAAMFEISEKRTVPYVHSGYARRPEDDYRTIDTRCVKALFETWPVRGITLDCCAPNGSGITDELHRLGLADCMNCGGVEFHGNVDWIITNPPYIRGVVDAIAGAIVCHVHTGKAKAAALLMRANWDLAAGRAALFANRLYRGQTRMRFRPWWTEERKAYPIHNYVWHVWRPQEVYDQSEPVIRYWPIA